MVGMALPSSLLTSGATSRAISAVHRLPSEHSARPTIRGLHSSAFRLNVSTFCGTGGASRGCLGGVGGVKGY